MAAAKQCAGNRRAALLVSRRTGQPFGRPQPRWLASSGTPSSLATRHAPARHFAKLPSARGKLLDHGRRVGVAEADSQQRFARRNGRRPDAGHEQAPPAKFGGRLHRRSGIADDDRNDLPGGIADSPPLLDKRSAQRGRSIQQRQPALRLVAHDVEALPAPPRRPPADARWRRHTTGPDSPASRSACGCPQRTHRRWPAPCSACPRGSALRVPLRPAPPVRGRRRRTRRSHGLRRSSAWPDAAAQIDQIGQRRHIAVHAEERVADDQPPTKAGRCAEQFGEPRQSFAMRINPHLGPRQPAAIDQARMILAVGQHDVATADYRRDRAAIRGESGGKYQRRIPSA